MVWMDEFDNVLYYNENHVIDDIRFKLSHSGTKWDLIIQNVTRRDAGKYRCFSNAQPLQLHYYYDLVVLGKRDYSQIHVAAPQVINFH